MSERVLKRRFKELTGVAFPPESAGAWRALSRPQRWSWIGAACALHFQQMKRKRGWRDAPPGSVFRINGAEVRELSELFCSLGEAINGPGGYFGQGLSSLQDCLYRGFGVQLPFVLQIANVDVCRDYLGGPALAEWARFQSLLRGDDRTAQGRQWLTEKELDGLEGECTLIDEVIRSLQLHGVHVEGSNSQTPEIFRTLPRLGEFSSFASSTMGERFSGVYEGRCRNLTDEAETRLDLLVRASGRITGEIEIGAPLKGSGYLVGRIESNRLIMTSHNDVWIIHWQGRATDMGFEGDYRVEASFEIEPQSGSWRATKTSRAFKRLCDPGGSV